MGKVKSSLVSHMGSPIPTSRKGNILWLRVPPFRTQILATLRDFYMQRLLAEALQRGMRQKMGTSSLYCREHVPVLLGLPPRTKAHTLPE